MNKFKVGDYVKYIAPNGSIGQVADVTETSYSNGPWYTVEWVYGLDANKVPMTAISRNLKGYDLEPITNEQYLAVHDRDGWSHK